jgi:hypothetical protein
MQAEELIGFIIQTLATPAGFIGFCCGLSRSLPAILGGAIAATALQTFLTFAVSEQGIDRDYVLYLLVTPIAALLASLMGWIAARVFFGRKADRDRPVPDESVRLAYKHDLLEPGATEDF